MNSENEQLPMFYERISAQDRSFLHFEDATTHMHLGGLILFFSVSQRLPSFPLGAGVVGFFVLVTDGWLTLMRSRQIARFR